MKRLAALLLFYVLSAYALAFGQGFPNTGGGGSSTDPYYVAGVFYPTTNTTLTVATPDEISCGGYSLVLTLPISTTCKGKKFHGWCRGGVSVFQTQAGDNLFNLSGNGGTGSYAQFGTGSVYKAGVVAELESDGAQWVVLRSFDDMSTTNHVIPVAGNSAVAPDSAQFTYGTVTLSSGSATVTDNTVGTGTIITILQNSSAPTTEQFGYTVTNGASFTIHSSNSASTATVGYIRVN